MHAALKQAQKPHANSLARSEDQLTRLYGKVGISAVAAALTIRSAQTCAKAAKLTPKAGKTAPKA
ncbi:MAG: hypothetical protein AB7F96_02380 [Beijerinckiaceae bacterium]